MKAFFTNINGDVQILARMEGDNGMVGQFSHLVRDGELFLGWTVAELLELGDGEHEIEDKAQLMAEIAGASMDEESLQNLVDNIDK